MKFRMKGLEPTNKDLRDFRARWLEFIGQENIALNNGGICATSSAQEFLVNLFCGQHDRYPENQDEIILSSIMPPQQELEAVFRARNRVLAEMITNNMDIPAVKQ